MKQQDLVAETVDQAKELLKVRAPLGRWPETLEWADLHWTLVRAEGAAGIYRAPAENPGEYFECLLFLSKMMLKEV